MYQTTLDHSPAGICLFKFNSGNTRTMCKICSKLTIKTLERCHGRHSGLLLLTSKGFHSLFFYFHCEFEKVNASWVHVSSNYTNKYFP